VVVKAVKVVEKVVSEDFNLFAFIWSNIQKNYVVGRLVKEKAGEEKKIILQFTLLCYIRTDKKEQNKTKHHLKNTLITKKQKKQLSIYTKNKQFYFSVNSLSNFLPQNTACI